MNWYVLKMRSSLNALRFRELLTAAQIEFFLPTVHKVVTKEGKEESVEKPLLFSYVFMRTDERRAIDFTAANNGITMLREHVPGGQPGPYMIVSDRAMESFIRAVGYYTDSIPFVSPTPEMLVRGDRVRILGGPFQGVEGLLESQQGKDGGRVIVRVADVVAIPTIEIDPSLIQILEFAPSGKHLYKKLDSFEPRLRKAIDYRLHSKTIPTDLSDHVQMFIRRFCEMEVHALNARVRFQCYLVLAYALQHDVDHVRPIQDQLQELLPSIKSRSSRTLLKRTFELLPQLL